MHLSDLAKNTKQLVVNYDTGAGAYDIEIEYRVAAVTLAMINELDKLDAIERVVEQICRVVTDWNIFDGEEKLPITPEAINAAEIPLDLLVRILAAIREDQQLMSAEKKA